MRDPIWGNTTRIERVMVIHEVSGVMGEKRWARRGYRIWLETPYNSVCRITLERIMGTLCFFGFSFLFSFLIFWGDFLLFLSNVNGGNPAGPIESQWTSFLVLPYTPCFSSESARKEGFSEQRRGFGSG